MHSVTAGYVCCSFRGSVQALDAASGKVLWKTYTIAEAAKPGNGNRRVLVLPQKSAILHGVDPDQQGKILWQAKVGQGGTLGGIQWGALRLSDEAPKRLNVRAR